MLSIREVWDRVERWATQWAPEALNDLDAPASLSAIGHLEELLSRQLPEDYRTSLAVHDGTWARGPFEHALLSARDAASKWTSMKQASARSSDIERLRSRLGLEIVGPDTAGTWSPGWLPVFDDGSGMTLCIDLDGGAGGYKGQIIEVAPRHSDKRPIVAASFRDLLQEQLRRLESRELVAVEWGGFFWGVVERDLVARHGWEHLRVRGEPRLPYATGTPEVEAARIVELLVHEGVRFHDETTGRRTPVVVGVAGLANMLRSKDFDEQDAETALGALRGVADGLSLTPTDLLVRVRRLRSAPP